MLLRVAVDAERLAVEVSFPDEKLMSVSSSISRKAPSKRTSRFFHGRRVSKVSLTLLPVTPTLNFAGVSLPREVFDDGFRLHPLWMPWRQLLPSSLQSTTLHPFIARETHARALFINSSTPHIPEPKKHLVHFYGAYANRIRSSPKKHLVHFYGAYANRIRSSTPRVCDSEQKQAGG